MKYIDTPGYSFTTSSGGYNSVTLSNSYKVKKNSFLKISNPGFFNCPAILEIAIDENNADSSYSDLSNMQPNYQNRSKNWKLMVKTTYSKAKSILLNNISYQSDKVYSISLSYNGVNKGSASISVRGK